MKNERVSRVMKLHCRANIKSCRNMLKQKYSGDCARLALFAVREDVYLMTELRIITEEQGTKIITKLEQEVYGK